MPNRLLPAALVCAGVLVIPVSTFPAEFADTIAGYNPGSGFATDFSSGRGLTNAASALGSPSVSTPGPFGGPVEPFNPPYLADQVVSIGTGGSLVLGFTSPIRNDPLHAFGIDFILYGNSGYVITNGNFSGGGITDGSLFGADSGQTRVSVSADNINYYELDPARAPVADTLFPTDGSGSFDLPVDPALAGEDFAGLDLAGIRLLYAGSAGGTGFDLSWAMDNSGQAIALPDIHFIRIDVLAGVAEIDAAAVPGVVPEPATGVLLGLGVAAAVGGFGLTRRRWRCSALRVQGAWWLIAMTFWKGLSLDASAAGWEETFATDPANQGWQVQGDTELFGWDAVGSQLLVRWISSRPNSYFYRALPSTVTKADDFSVQFDLQLTELSVGTTPGRPFTFEIAAGLINSTAAFSTNFLRGTGSSSPNLVELDYFPDSGFGATLSPTIVSSNNQFRSSFTFPLELTPGPVFHVELSYTAADQTLRTVLLRDGELAGPIKDVTLGAGFSDFQLNAFAVSSYNDEGADGSVTAAGTIDNVVIRTPARPQPRLTLERAGSSYQVQLASAPGWSYLLERSVDYQEWTPVSTPAAGTGSALILADETDGPPLPVAFYRVRLSQ